MFVSSHLLSEMALLADELVVIGRGRMISSRPGQLLHRRRQPQVGARAHAAGRPSSSACSAVGDGVTAQAGADGEVVVTGLDAREIGDLAFDNRIRLHRLAPQTATLEDAFLAATEGDEEFQAAVVPHAQRPADGGAA